MIIDSTDPEQCCYAQCQATLERGEVPIVYPKPDHPGVLKFASWKPGPQDSAMLTSPDQFERFAMLIILVNEIRISNHDPHIVPV